MLLDIAKKMAREAHAGQTYSTGKPYFDYHIMNVVKRVKSDPVATDDHVLVAYLHDIVEDTSVTVDMLEHTFGPRIAEAVNAMTRTPETETYDKYLDRVKRNPLAVVVKRHDLTENLGHCFTAPRGGLIARYTKALKKLSI